MEQGQPAAITFTASSEAIDAFFGTKGSSPRIVPDQAKLAVTDCASTDFAMSRTFGAVQHCGLLGLIAVLADLPSFAVAGNEPARFPIHAPYDNRDERLN